MKSSNVLVLAIAFGVTACGRQMLDAGAAGAAGAPEPARTTVTSVVAAPRAPAPSLGRGCSASGDCSWWQDPDPAFVCCAGTCMNTRADPFNCGGCGRACSPGQICADSSCQAPGAPALGDPVAGNTWNASCADTVCATGEICCGGLCVRTDRDAGNCGACGVACTATGVICASGVCCPAAMPVASCHPAATCADDRVLCGAACVNIGSDAANCGACGAACPPSAPTCVSGLCVALSR